MSVRAIAAEFVWHWLFYTWWNVLDDLDLVLSGRPTSNVWSSSVIPRVQRAHIWCVCQDHCSRQFVWHRSFYTLWNVLVHLDFVVCGTSNVWSCPVFARAQRADIWGCLLGPLHQTNGIGHFAPCRKSLFTWTWFYLVPPICELAHFWGAFRIFQGYKGRPFTVSVNVIAVNNLSGMGHFTLGGIYLFTLTWFYLVLTVQWMI